MESTPVSFRLENQLWARYSAAAQAEGVSLATHLRTRLERKDRLECELGSLRHLIEQAMSTTKQGFGKPLITPGALLEVLLLLRTLVGPQKAAIAQKEVERRGLEVWR